MLARKIQASAVSMAVSKSLASRRFRLSQASVRSTTHRRGRSWKAFTPAGRLTISSVKRLSILTPNRRAKLGNYIE